MREEYKIISRRIVTRTYNRDIFFSERREFPRVNIEYNIELMRLAIANRYLSVRAKSNRDWAAIKLLNRIINDSDVRGVTRTLNRDNGRKHNDR